VQSQAIKFRHKQVHGESNGHLGSGVRALLRHKKVEVNIQDDLGNTALIDACRQCHLDVVRELLNHNGADCIHNGVDFIHNDHSVTAFHVARSFEQGYVDYFEVVLPMI
jgi:ankyrin repeat protein